MARRTFATVTSLSVQAHASSAQQWISLTLVDIHAVLHHHESAFIAFIALALKVPGGVHTLASATEVRGYAAFVDVCAVPFFRIQSKAAITSALEAANGVPALAVGAQVGNHLTLVDVFEKPFAICNFFCGESGSSGTELLVLRCVSHGTLLALLGAPGCPDRAAAGVHAVAPRHRQGALLVLVPQEAGLQADI